MRSSHSLDRVDTAFDGTQLVADAGLLLPVETVESRARHLPLQHLHLVPKHQELDVLLI